MAMREELVGRWNELKVPVGERVDALVALLDAAKTTPQLLTTYEAISGKLSARQPIAQVIGCTLTQTECTHTISQLISRKQYIEYKLKLASRIGGEGSNLSAADRAQLITELTELQSNADQLVRQFEKKYGESYFKGAPQSSGAFPTTTLSLQQLSQMSPTHGPPDAFPSTPLSPAPYSTTPAASQSSASSTINSFSNMTPVAKNGSASVSKLAGGMGRK